MSQRRLPLPELAYLQACFAYEPQTGRVVWLRRPREHFPTNRAWNRWNEIWPGKVAGTERGAPYRQVKLAGRNYTAHRVIWCLMTGIDPPEGVDHENRDKRDNRWDNLREATSTQNNANRKRLRSNTSGHQGVRWHAQSARWQVAIRINGTRRQVGSFVNFAKACQAYDREAAEAWGDFYKPD